MLRDIDFQQIILGTHFWLKIINSSEYPCVPSKRGGFIYALVDPRDGRFRYVGKTIDPQARYASHLQDAKKYLYSKSKTDWINELVERGYRPVMLGLATLSIEQLPESEQQFIELLQKFRCPLTNIVRGRVHSDALTRLETELECFSPMWSSEAFDIEMYINWLQRAGHIKPPSASVNVFHAESPIEVALPCYEYGDCPNCNPSVQE
ncbi:MAG: GIY-YIG nuclease family protein [Thermoproteota archaeon]|nr:GIY-YIG nuclease family protein [Acidobacteriota bacterium]MDQ3903319.1 GIY-YIG nuclease family protein [Thermoproteota archaeon]